MSIENNKYQLKKECPVNERSQNPLVKVNRLAYMRYASKDLDKSIAFFQDFGLSLDIREGDTVYFRAIDHANYTCILQKADKDSFVFGFAVDSYNTLSRLAKKMQVEIKKRSCPLGGSFVELTDMDGNLVEVNHGLNELEVQPHYESGVTANTPLAQPRLNTVVRPKFAPPPIDKIGHTVLGVAKIKDAIHWYQDTLGLIVSDFQMLKGETLPTMAFMRCDNGSTPSDHHTLAILSTMEVGHAHTAFEVSDIDLIAMGNKWLKAKDYRHSWGIGRHILGSQIFDYWRDPAGFAFEHYCDGDMFDADVPTGYSIFKSANINQWGPDVTKDMLGNKPSPGLLVRALKHLFANNDLNVKRLIRLIQST